MDNNLNVWFALVNVEPLSGNEFLPIYEGAYVNVAALANDKENFLTIIANQFDYYKFKVIKIEDVMNRKDIKKLNNERLKLNQILSQDYEFAWGTFNVYPLRSNVRNKKSRLP